jgi:glutamate formiminotransferase
LGVPTFLYGPLPDGGTRSLPDVRRHAFADLAPDFGPPDPHATAGASAVGARAALVAYNIWVSSPDIARTVASQVRGPYLRALGLAVGERAQVSCNLIDPARLGPAQVYDVVATRVEAAGGEVAGAELVGLLPSTTLQAIAPARWAELDLSEDRTVEARLERAGLLGA